MTIVVTDSLSSLFTRLTQITWLLLQELKRRYLHYVMDVVLQILQNI